MKQLSLIALLASSSAWATQAAQPQAGAVASAGSFFQVLMGLIVVLALMAAVAWALKRFNLARITGNAPVKIVGGVSVGNRERVIVVEVAEQWIVVGVAAGQVNALTTMPRPRMAIPDAPQPVPPAPQFSTWLKQKIDQRNAK